MDDQDTLELLFEAATSLAQAAVPPSVAAALTTARLTALSKRDGSSGQSNWLFVSAVGRAYSARAGTVCVGHLLRAATDVSPSATVLSVDGIGAYDHVLRVVMLGRLERHVREPSSHSCDSRTHSLPRTVGSTKK